jgi:hypothetical protein
MPGRWRLRRPLSPPRVFRRYQITTEIMSQASVAQIITSHEDRRGISRHTATAHAMRPILPIAAPAASRPAASLHGLFRPSVQAVSLFFFSCFSTGGRTGWENRRKRQEQASDSGTPFVGNQSGDSDGSPECKTESKFIPLGFFRELKHPGLFSLAYFKATYQSPKAGGSHAYEDRRTCNCRG